MPRRPPVAAVLIVLFLAALLGGSVALASELRDSKQAILRSAAEPAAPAPPAPTPWPPEGATPTPTPTPSPAPAPLTEAPPPPAGDGVTDTPIRWRSSRAVGLPFRGRLVRGVELPAGGRDYFTWDPILKTAPNRSWRRYGTDRLIRTLLAVLADYRAANPGAPRVGIGDLSRPHGGIFDQRFGGLGHASHQNGLDVDVYYPRADRTERRPYRPDLVDRTLAQDLVDRFVAAGAQYVFVGPRVGLRGPKKVVSPLAHHDDHLHFRLPAR
ncbi:MAG TPA: penicillin-insensitive murein endopeptidase [Solirubrobacteraceae bacterium]|jgi:hypothetical protein